MKRSSFTAVLLVALFAAMGFAYLDRVPLAHEDEAWIAAPGYGLFTTGRFASDLLRGFFGSERHAYGTMPLFPILSGFLSWLLGAGLLPLRLASLSCAIAVLALTYLVGKRLLPPGHAVLALVLLVTWPLASSLPALTTGIPLLDLARLARYDILVPVFELLGFLTLLPVLSGSENFGRSVFLAGVFAGLATLGHVYGAGALAAFAVCLLAARRPARTLAPLLGGFALALLPWLVCVAAGWTDFLAQNAYAKDRVALLSPLFYLENVAGEWHRYGPILKAAREGALAPWLFAAALLSGGIFLARRARVDAKARALLVFTLTLTGLFLLFLRPRSFNYLAALWPFFALVAAAGLAPLFAARKPVRVAAALLMLVASLEGAFAMERLLSRGAHATPYARLSAELCARLPKGARVAMLPQFWPGLRSHVACWSLHVPVFLARADSNPRPIPFAEALSIGAPDLVLLDERMLEFLGTPRGDPHGAFAEEVSQALSSRRTRVQSTFTDPSYGRFEIWALR